MKLKRLLATSLAIATLLGCSKPVTVPVSPDKDTSVPEALPISFSPYLVHTTKAPVTTTDYLKKEEAGFGVSAVYTRDSLWSETVSRYPGMMFNSKVFWDGEMWNYKPPKFWPTLKGEYISFFAYAPYNAPGITLCDTSRTDADITRLHLKLAEKSNETVDFVAACVTDGKGTIEDPRVIIELKPELTRIEMFAKVDEDLYQAEGEDRKTRIVIKSAKFTGPKFYTGAEYSYNTENTSDIGQWDFSNSTAEEYPIVLKGEDYRLETAIPYIAENAYILTNQHSNYQMLEDSAPGENYIFILPPGGDKGIEYEDISVVFDYDILTEDPKLAPGYSCTSATKTVNLPVGTLRQGYSYKFTFRFHLDRIEVSAAIVPSDYKEDENLETEV